MTKVKVTPVNGNRVMPITPTQVLVVDKYPSLPMEETMVDVLRLPGNPHDIFKLRNARQEVFGGKVYKANPEIAEELTMIYNQYWSLRDEWEKLCSQLTELPEPIPEKAAA